MKTTPLKAIRRKCLDCSCGEWKAVNDCVFDGTRESLCVFYSFRMGKGRPKLKQIRAFCLSCCCKQSREVMLCPVVSCSLWEYRHGKRSQNASSWSEIGFPEGVFQPIGIGARG